MCEPRKLLPRHENPIDNVIYATIVQPLTPALRHSLPWLTPNHITYMSIAFGASCIYFFSKGFYVASSICFMLSYIFDCLDGYYARSYGMTSEFGDWLDHASDWALGFSLFSCILVTPSPYRLTKLALYILCLFLMAYHFRCQEELVGGGSDSIDFVTRPMTCSNPERKLVYTRFAGAGTFHFIASLLILSYAV